MLKSSIVQLFHVEKLQYLLADCCWFPGQVGAVISAVKGMRQIFLRSPRAVCIPAQTFILYLGRAQVKTLLHFFTSQSQTCVGP